MNAVNLHIFFRKLIKNLYSLILNPPSTTVMESFNKKPQWIPVNLSGICGALTWPRFARSLCGGRYVPLQLEQLCPITCFLHKPSSTL